MALQLPRLFLLPKHDSANPKNDFSFEERDEIENELNELENRPLTYDAKEAEVFVGKIFSKSRALLDLRRFKIFTKEVRPHEVIELDNDDSDMSAGDWVIVSPTTAVKTAAHDDTDTIKVVKLAWLTDSLKRGEVLPYGGNLIYEGQKVEEPPTEDASTEPQPAKPQPAGVDIPKQTHFSYNPRKRQSESVHTSPASRPRLLHETTSEQDLNSHLPPIPDSVNKPYACQRPTPLHPPNEAFIEQLEAVRTARKLNGDEIGVRAYSTSIASLCAYPYTLSTPAEVARLPGCSDRIASLFQDFLDTGEVSEAATSEADERMIVLRVFSKIFGVAHTTANDFFNKGWREIDDIVEEGWKSLSRVQQIGVKYFDELQEGVPRDEVQKIADVILSRANDLIPGFEMVVVGSYRRGKESSGDVDVVLSHRDENATSRFIEKLVVKLETEKYVTHTLSLTTRNSERGQKPTSWKAERQAAGGFDTLDKALTIWQDPNWEQEAEAEDDVEKKKNPNPHRQVDIIISPWKTVGCAVLGWSGGTTFQRDLRRYCKKERGLKFDSSGIRRRADGGWEDLEDGGCGPAPDMHTAERRVFEGLKLEYRRPEERCTR